MQNPAEPGPHPKGRENDEEPSAGSAPSNSLPIDKESLAAAQVEASANRDRYLRAAADLDNYRRRAAREKEEIRQFACEKLITALLPIMDSLALASNSARTPNANPSALMEGVNMVLTQLRTTLAEQGLVELTPTGERFDPHQHEAISHQNDPSVPEGNIISVVRSGYTLNTRLLRPASVIISTGPAVPGRLAQ